MAFKSRHHKTIKSESKQMLLHLSKTKFAWYLLLAEQGFDCPTPIFLFNLFFFSFSSQLLPLPVLLFQRRGVNRASWIPTQRGKGQRSLPRHLICAWQPVDRMEGWGWVEGIGGTGDGKGYRMEWEKYKKMLWWRCRSKKKKSSSAVQRSWYQNCFPLQYNKPKSLRK